MTRIRFARRALHDLWEYDRWRTLQNRDWDPVASSIREAISDYLQRFSTYGSLPFRAVTIWDERDGQLMDIELKRVLIPFRGKQFRVYVGTGANSTEILVWRIRHPQQRSIEQ